METNPKLKYLRDLIEADKVGIEPSDSLQVLEDLQPSQILQLCIQLARQFLPLYEYYVAKSQWVRLALNRIQQGQPLEEMAFPYPFDLPFKPNSDLESALMAFHEGMVFLSIIYEYQLDPSALLIKAAISIFHFVVALTEEFSSARYKRTWEYIRDDYGIENIWITPRQIPEVRAYYKHLWLNVADEIEIYLLSNTNGEKGQG